METTFKVGDAVRADVTAQGLRRGDLYQVVHVAETFSTFGIFVTYTLRGADGVAREIINGHWILSKVAPAGAGR